MGRSKNFCTGCAVLETLVVRNVAAKETTVGGRGLSSELHRFCSPMMWQQNSSTRFFPKMMSCQRESKDRREQEAVKKCPGPS